MKLQIGLNTLLFVFFSILLFWTVGLRSQSFDIKDVKSELQLLRSEKNFDETNPEHITLLSRLGNLMNYTKPDTMLIISNEVRKLSEISNYKKGKIDADIILAHYYTFTGKSEEAISLIGNALNASITENYYRQAIEASNILAMANMTKARYAETFLSFQNAIDFALKSNENWLVSKTYMNMATFFSLLNAPDEALDHYDIALSNLDETSEPVLFAQILSNIAYLQNTIGNYTKALLDIDKSINLLNELDNPAWLAFSFNVKGSIFVKQNNYEAALIFYEKSQQVHESLQDIKGRGDMLLGLAQTHFGLNNLVLSEEYAFKAADLFGKMKLKSGLERTHRLLSKIKELQEQNDEALSHLQKALALSDSIAKNDNRANILVRKTKIEYDKKQQLIAQENELRNNRQNNFILFVSTALFGALFFAYSSYRSNEKEKKLNLKLINKTKSLEKSKTALQEINTMKDQLFSIIGHDLKGPIINLRQLLRFANAQDINDKDFKTTLLKLTDHTDSVQFTLDNLILWGKTQFKGSKTNQEAVKLNDISKCAVRLFTEPILKKELKVMVAMEENNTVWADKNHLDLIMRNLLSNAIKFSHRNGEIKITSEKTNDTVITKVQDSGQGIEKGAIEKIFDAKLNYTTYGTVNEKGTGLGLKLCMEAVKSNGGKLWIESSADKGTTVCFELPAAKIENY